MIHVSKEDFEAFVKRHSLAVPDGFRVIGSFFQSRWMLSGVEVARESIDGFGTIYEVKENLP